MYCKIDFGIGQPYFLKTSYTLYIYTHTRYYVITLSIGFLNQIYLYDYVVCIFFFYISLSDNCVLFLYIGI